MRNPMHVLGMRRAPDDLERAVRALSSTLALTPGEARSRLRGEFPCVLALVEPSDAAFLIAELSQAGLSVLSFDDAFVKGPALSCQRLEPGAQGWSCALTDGTTRMLPLEAVELVCRGIRTLFRKREVLQTVKYDRHAPPWVTQHDEESKAIQFLWIFTRADEWLSADAETMRFRATGHLTTAANLDALAEQLAKGPPPVRYSRALMTARPLPFPVWGEVTLRPQFGSVVQADSSLPGLRVMAELLRRTL